MSEPGVTSDKNSGKRRGFVRTRYDFGQNHQEKPMFCPNPGQLQTKIPGSAVVLSKPGVASERIKRRSLVLVTQDDFCLILAGIRAKPNSKWTYKKAKPPSNPAEG